MEMKIDQKGNSKVAIISSDSIIINNVNDALDVMANVQYNECEKMLLRKEHLTEDFFDLKTGLAGEVLQKYTNYKMKIAFVGEFKSYNSKSLNDFMYESNKGNQVFFKQTEEEALEALHGINT
ncbi:DUF4180 domain-containing protein [Brevibacillus laterosporus]|uniref:DUF4180 domain-containing protein n=1 Tax=Brevibacillus laterosporus TaxID=1465 RepID=A0AAP8U4Q2_BRELA|nr:DUF4180 domain-containing protein [Brevibacillus laterosporus]MCR8981119.1 DUF4180 domain-containing protein [Brevibacillus laterosporus]MCZ0808274.1 DUF4180 domain-containing protein [Brevibacillus laterosporus]MCZ0826633.1 DUF4180 domain-containing protein [Brevibacillus laterosporus]MCZ0850446.1 DUF4180 domain-containing protein [Brevibacillus laterosporus]MED1663862.1 DUF4180 domain-containing protein [Brevibacillus laterosporus]